MDITMRKGLVWLFPLLMPVQVVDTEPSVNSPIKANEFPSVAARIPFFEKRINATDPRIRERVVIQVGYFYFLPDKDHVQFFRRMMHDPEPWIRGQAIKNLHEMWVQVDVEDLPQTFCGYHREQILNLQDESQIPQLIAQCRNGGAPGGWAAYALGVLQCRQAVPDLVKLGGDANSAARYIAGRALLDCGAKKEAKTIFEQLMAHQFKPRAQGFEPAGYRPGEPDPYYVALAARAYQQTDAAARKVGMKRLVTLLGELEPSKDVNDQNRLETARGLLAATTGQFFVSHHEALEWFEKHEAIKE
jgi:hypothetical protein